MTDEEAKALSDEVAMIAAVALRGESPAEEIARLQREIGQRQSRLQYLVLGDQMQGVTIEAAPWKLSADY